MRLFERINEEIRGLYEREDICTLDGPLRQAQDGDETNMLYFDGVELRRFFPDDRVKLEIAHYPTSGRYNPAAAFENESWVHEVDLIAVGPMDYLPVVLKALKNSGVKTISYNLRGREILKLLNVGTDIQNPELQAFSVRYTFTDRDNYLKTYCSPCEKP